MNAVVTYILVASAQIPAFILLYNLCVGTRDDEKNSGGWGRWWLFTLVPILCLFPLIGSGLHLYFNTHAFSASLIVATVIVTLSCILGDVLAYHYCIRRRRRYNVPTSPEVFTMMIFHSVAVILATWCICL